MNPAGLRLESGERGQPNQRGLPGQVAAVDGGTFWFRRKTLSGS